MLGCDGQNLIKRIGVVRLGFLGRTIYLLDKPRQFAIVFTHMNEKEPSFEHLLGVCRLRDVSSLEGRALASAEAFYSPYLDSAALPMLNALEDAHNA